MKATNSLLTIILISFAGILFSGYLTFSELSSGACSLGGCQAILGLPTCLYGLIMYLLVFIIALLGIKKK